MARSLINSFYIDDTKYSHRIDTLTDATSIDDGKEILFTINSSAHLFGRESSHLGKFQLDEDNLWYFKDKSGPIIKTETTSMFKAEVHVITQLLVA